jgi:hypothetical protein
MMFPTQHPACLAVKLDFLEGIMGADILRLHDSATDECDNPATGVENRFQNSGDRQVQVILWDYVKGLLKKAEQEEIKKALGVPAIEENEQLFTEAASLEEILFDLQQGTEKQAEVQKLFQTPARSMVSSWKTFLCLPIVLLFSFFLFLLLLRKCSGCPNFTKEHSKLLGYIYLAICFRRQFVRDFSSCKILSGAAKQKIHVALAMSSG